MSRRRRGDTLSVAVVIRHFTTTGGAEKYAVAIAQRMAVRRHRVHVFARHIDADAARGMQCHRIPDQAAFSSVLSLCRFVNACAKRIDLNAFDVVHAHEKGIQCDITTAHTFSYRHPLHSLARAAQLRSFYLSPRGLLYFCLEKRQFQSRAIAAVSTIVKRDIDRHFPGRRPIHTIPPGVDLAGAGPGRRPDGGDRNLPFRHAGRQDKLNVLFVGSEFRRKGLDHLIPALPDQATLTVVGGGDRHGHYHRLVKTAGRENDVVFAGLVDDVTPYFAAADVLVLPSVREAFGMAALEAMAAGLPVVVSAVAGIADLIASNENGFVCQNMNEIRGILEHLKDPVLRRAIGSKARTTAMRYSWDLAADRYESIYTDLCAEKRRGRSHH